MAGIDNAYLLEVMGKLQSSEFEELKYILQDSLTGKFHGFTVRLPPRRNII